MRSEGHWNTHTTTLEGRTPKALHLVAGMTAKERKRKKNTGLKGHGAKTDLWMER